MDTIFGVATAPGRAGVAVVRLSGPKVREALVVLGAEDVHPRRVCFRHLRTSNGPLDEAIVLFFPAPGSYTGEDVVELQLHGSPAIVAETLRSLGDIPGLRPAEAGEFTRRALENGRLSLAEIEGLGDLLSAETEVQRRQAMRLFAGEMADSVARWRNDIVRAAALLEATIDFADEEVPEDVSPEVLEILDRVWRELDAEIRGFPLAERIRSGFEIAILGRPNVGKSTLLNALAKREAAITSEIAGTTRDVIEVRMDLGGLPVTFLDTAGLRDAADPVERIGVDRTRSRAAAADLRLVLLDDAGLPEGVVVFDDDIVLRSKIDLATGQNGSVRGVSGLTGEGLVDLVEMVRVRLSERTAYVGMVSHVRQADAVKRASSAVAKAIAEMSAKNGQSELAAEWLREAVVAFDGLLGRVDVEAYLDVVFANFCIGK